MPYDEGAERALVASLLASPYQAQRIAHAVQPDDFANRNLRRIYVAVLGLIDEGLAVDSVTVAARVDGTGEPIGREKIAVLQMEASARHATAYADVVIERSSRRRLIGAAASVSEAAYDVGVPYASVRSLAVEALQKAALPTVADPAPALDVFVGQEQDEYDWIVPGLLERGDRCLVVSIEGGGKSTLLRQIAVMVSQGVHPFSGQRFDPMRVLLVDLENPPRLLRRRLRELRDQIVTVVGAGYDEERLRVQARPEGLDVRHPVDALRLLKIVDASRPDLVVIGPLYKLHEGAEEDSSDVRQVQKILDTIRTDFGCALLMETHAPHSSFGTQAGAGKVRPAGSRVWIRWPEFILALVQTSGTDWRVEEVRTGRDIRPWPKSLTRSGYWPWTAPSMLSNDPYDNEEF